jgi:hypothetical protein
MVLAQKQTQRPIEEKDPEINLHNTSYLILDKRTQQMDLENWAYKCRRLKLDSCLTLH